MSFILSWRGYFIRKSWDPLLWAEANKIKSYEQCAKRISKMCVTPPTEAEYLTNFVRAVLPLGADPDDPNAGQPKQKKAPKPPEVFVKETRPEPTPAAELPKEDPQPAEEKPKPKRAPRRRTTKKPAKSVSTDTGSGTSSIIDSATKKTKTRRTRSRKNVKSS